MTEIMRHHVTVDCRMFGIFARDGIAMPSGDGSAVR